MNIIILEAQKLYKQADIEFNTLKNNKESLKLIEEILKINEKHSKALILKGDILISLGKIKEAKEAYEKAILANPLSAQGYASKAYVLDLLDEQKEALQCCKFAFTCDLNTLENDFIMSLLDQKLSLLVRFGLLEEAQSVLSQAFSLLEKEDASYLASCYQDYIYNKKLKII